MERHAVGRYYRTAYMLPALILIVDIAILTIRRVLHQVPDLFDLFIILVACYNVFQIWRGSFPFRVSARDGEILFRGRALKPNAKCKSVIRLDSGHVRVKFNFLVTVQVDGQSDAIDALEESFLSIKSS